MRNEDLFKEAKKYIPGGVNSPVRAFKAVGGTPKFIKSARGSKITDEEGKEYIDYVCSWGPLILGHANEIVISALTEAMSKGTSYGAPCEIEIKLAKLVCESVPSIEAVRMVNSGTEAVMSAARLARAYTKRNCILKFNGCYHGHADSFLVQAGSGLATFNSPSSPGVTQDNVKDTLLCEFNDLEALKKIFEKRGSDIAAVILEPVPGNMGVILPRDGYLSALREITSKNKSLLIFDEVISGFRVSKGGAQSYYSVMPDITTLGKIIGGGLPVGAYGGKKEIMSMISPDGPVYQAGTLSGNPLAMTAGYTTLKYLIDQNPYADLERKRKIITDKLISIISKKGYPVSLSGIASMFCLFFNDQVPKNWEEAARCDTKKFSKFFNSMLSKGIYIAPSQFEASFVSTAHSEEDLEKTVTAINESLELVFGK